MVVDNQYPTTPPPVKDTVAGRNIVHAKMDERPEQPHVQRQGGR